MAADARSKTAETATHWQRFAVPYEFPVVFTEGVFDCFKPFPNQMQFLFQN